MKLGLNLFAIYFGLSGFVGLFRAGSTILGADDLLLATMSVFVTLAISGVYIYFAFQLKSLLLNRKGVIQLVLLLVMIRNLLVIFYGADVPVTFTETDLLGKFLTFMIFGGSI